jgi:hypothetical protein
MQTTYPLKIQEMRSKGKQPRFYVSFPLALAAAIGLEGGEMSASAVFDGDLFKLFDGGWCGNLRGLVEVRPTGGPVPQTPWDLSLYACSGKGPYGAARHRAEVPFPVSVPLRAYRAGNGKRWFGLIVDGWMTGLAVRGERTPRNRPAPATRVPENGSKLIEGRRPRSLAYRGKKRRFSPRFPCPGSKLSNGNY